MKVSVNIWTVLVGAARSGKSAFVKRLTKKELGKKYVPTIEFESASVWDRSYRYQLVEFAGGGKIADISTYLQKAKLVLFFINPLSEDFEKEKQDFLHAWKAGNYNTENLQGLIIIFTHRDLWQDFAKVKFQRAAFSELKCKVLGFSALTSSADEVLSVMQEMVYDKKLETEYVQAILAKLKHYQLEASKRFLKPDGSRTLTITNLKVTLSQTISLAEIRTALIDTARNIREPRPNGKLKYGVNFFKWHYGNYQNSMLYQLMEAELAELDSSVKLDKESKPCKRMTSVNADMDEFSVTLTG